MPTSSRLKWGNLLKLAALVPLVVILLGGCQTTRKVVTNPTGDDEAVVIVGMALENPPFEDKSGWFNRGLRLIGGNFKRLNDKSTETPVIHFGQACKMRACTEELKKAKYAVHKVTPGTYFLSEMNLQVFASAVETEIHHAATMDFLRRNDLPYFNVAAGEVLYIGDLVFNGQYSPYRLDRIDNNMAGVKAYLADYTELTQAPVFRPMINGPAPFMVSFTKPNTTVAGERNTEAIETPRARDTWTHTERYYEVFAEESASKETNKGLIRQFFDAEIYLVPTKLRDDLYILSVKASEWDFPSFATEESGLLRAAQIAKENGYRMIYVSSKFSMNVRKGGDRNFFTQMTVHFINEPKPGLGTVKLLDVDQVLERYSNYHFVRSGEGTNFKPLEG